MVNLSTDYIAFVPTYQRGACYDLRFTALDPDQEIDILQVGAAVHRLSGSGIKGFAQHVLE